jgi:hypothetical protein
MAPVIPDNPEALLTRDAAAAALTAAGYPVRAKTLSTKATRGGGPPFRRFGAKPLYRWGDALGWAQSRLSPPLENTSDASAALSSSKYAGVVRQVRWGAGSRGSIRAPIGLTPPRSSASWRARARATAVAIRPTVSSKHVVGKLGAVNPLAPDAARWGGLGA